MLDTLFKSFVEPLVESWGHTKIHRSSRTNEAGDEAYQNKREWMELELARRESLVDEETRQIRARDMAAGASSYISMINKRITSDGGY